MTTIWGALGTSLQPVLIAILTAATLGLLRLIMPTVRWSRRLKHDGEIYGSLPDGKEKQMWAASLTAQAERLRLYRENTRAGDQFFAWYAFITLVGAMVAFVSDATHGWAAIRAATRDDLLLVLPMSLLLILNLGFALSITVRLIIGASISFKVDGSGHYPKYERFERAAAMRSAKRARVARRVAELRSREARALKTAKRELDPKRT